MFREDKECVVQNIVRDKRTKLGMKQDELAEKVHVSQAQIARVENYSYAPTLKTITKIANGLDLELTFIDRSTKELVKI